MKFRVRDYFIFTDRERNGTIVLLVLIVLMSGYIFLQKEIFAPPSQDFSQFDQLIASLGKLPEKDSAKEETENSRADIPAVAEEAGQHSVFQQKQLFVFNPNGLAVNDWVRLGLSPAQAKSIKNYEAKGGKFETKADVKKLFVISAERYAELEPFIALPEAGTNATNANSKPAARTTERRIIELNTADSSDLVSINGIGPTFAKRILAYRERLGGFRTVDQLTEVFGMDEEHYEQVKGNVKADSTYIRKINVNDATVSDLKKHPYIGPGVAQALVSYRKQHGLFHSVAEIQKCNLVNADLYRKIAGYLTI